MTADEIPENVWGVRTEFQPGLVRNWHVAIEDEEEAKRRVYDEYGDDKFLQTALTKNVFNLSRGSIKQID